MNWALGKQKNARNERFLFSLSEKARFICIIQKKVVPLQPN